MKLNLGSGGTSIDGYEARDGANGDVLFPLPDADGSVDEIRASHVLEHFSHGHVDAVLRDWVRALRPGGTLKIAVPDFANIVSGYQSGERVATQAYLMGGQVDDRDYHKCIFDFPYLRELMKRVGLRGIRRWQSEIDDCAALPVSLNLSGRKPGPRKVTVAAVMSIPRLGYMCNMGCVYELAKLGIVLRKTTGAFWGQCLTRAIEETLDEQAPDYILTIDYDSVFSIHHIDALLSIAEENPDVAAIAPLQAHRGHGKPLLYIRQPDGTGQTQIDRATLAKDLIDVESAHFGLTLLKSSAIRALAKPWFIGTPDREGRWGEGKVDDDIYFWRAMNANGGRVCVTPRVAIGHLVERILWPDVNLEPIYQDTGDYYNDGDPDNVWN